MNFAFQINSCLTRQRIGACREFFGQDLYMKMLFDVLKPIISLCQAVSQQGGTCYLVGGSVRDAVLGLKVKDIDIEVHRLTVDRLEQILSAFGLVKVVGKKFGVLRVGSHDVDWSLPRKDSKGRKPEVELDPFMSIEAALKRRDLTMNAMALDCKYIIDCGGDDHNVASLEQMIIDPYGGLEDIKHKRLRAVDQRLFIEDPLRFFRVMQFIGRFEMLPDESLTELCATMSFWDEAQDCSLAQERIHDEFKKLFLKSKQPSRGLFWLKDINRLEEVLPPLHQFLQQQGEDALGLILRQSDLMAQSKELIDETERYSFMIACLCAPLDDQGRRDLLKILTYDQSIHRYVRALLDREVIAKAEPTSAAVWYKFQAASIGKLLCLKQIFLFALLHNTIDQQRYDQHAENAARAGVLLQAEAPVLRGADLAGIIEPGPLMGELLEQAYQLQIAEDIHDPVELKKRILVNR